MGNWTFNKTDSKVFKQSVFDIKINGQCSSLDHSKKLSKLKTENPDIANVFLPVDCVEDIAFYTSAGFNFIESRFVIEKELSIHYSSNGLYPFVFERINEEVRLEKLVDQCSGMKFDDRYSCDPIFDKNLALKRNVFFLKQSFPKDNEPIYILTNKQNSEVLGFRSFRIENKLEASMLLTGVVGGSFSEKYLQMINTCELDVLSGLGVRYVSAVVSARNHSELNRYIAEDGYRIKDAIVVLRKLFYNNDI